MVYVMVAIILMYLLQFDTFKFHARKLEVALPFKQRRDNKHKNQTGKPQYTVTPPNKYQHITMPSPSLKPRVEQILGPTTQVFCVVFVRERYCSPATNKSLKKEIYKFDICCM